MYEHLPSRGLHLFRVCQVSPPSLSYLVLITDIERNTVLNAIAQTVSVQVVSLQTNLAVAWLAVVGQCLYRYLETGLTFPLGINFRHVAAAIDSQPSSSIITQPQAAQVSHLPRLLQLLPTSLPLFQPFLPHLAPLLSCSMPSPLPLARFPQTLQLLSLPTPTLDLLRLLPHLHIRLSLGLQQFRDNGPIGIRSFFSISRLLLRLHAASLERHLLHFHYQHDQRSLRFLLHGQRLCFRWHRVCSGVSLW